MSGSQKTHAVPVAANNPEITANPLGQHGYPDLAKEILYLNLAEQEKIESAYRFANIAHQGMNRKSGEAYITHPVAVAQILAGLKLDADTIVAGLLHDTVEDTPVSFDEIEEKFGASVRRIVEGETKVSKLSRMAKEHMEDEQAENLRQLLVAMTSDVRIIIAKLADRLHNMRTLGSMSDEQKRRIANETLEIYAPLAHRLGIGSLKWELEDLAFQYLKPTDHHQLEAQIRLDQAEREGFISRAIGYLENAMQADKELNQWLLRFEISGRSKHLYSIYTKMQRDAKNLEQIFDLLAIRVILEPKPVTDPNDTSRIEAENMREKRVCYHTLGIVHSLWTPIPGRFKDYIAVPKPNGYQSLHSTVISLEGQPLEVQIRTHRMHSVAEFGVAAHWLYKAGIEDPIESQKRTAGFNTWLEELKTLQHEIKDAGDFVDAVRSDILSNRVFVFTPKGDTVSLPYGATPVDLAYHIHTNVGHHAIGARVNGHIVPLSATLDNGDRVEIVTNRSSKPSKDWMGFAITRSARSKIRSFFRAQERQEGLVTGHDSLARYLRKRGLPAAKLMRTVVLEDATEKLLGTRNPDDLYLALAFNRLSNIHVARVLAPESIPASTPKSALRIQPARRPAQATGIVVDGINAPMKLAQCCRPVKGDEIFAYTTRGRGLSIHRNDCTNALRLKTEDPERCLEANWESSGQSLQSIDAQIIGDDRAGLLRDILEVFGEAHKSLLKIEANVVGATEAQIDVRFEVMGQTEFEELSTKLLRVRGLREVRRVGKNNAVKNTALKNSAAKNNIENAQVTNILETKTDAAKIRTSKQRTNKK